MRALGTILAAQQIGKEEAPGFDHILYGWIFFAVVIMLVLVLSWRFFDRPLGQPAVDIARIEASPSFTRLETMRIGAGAALARLFAILFIGQVWAQAADALSAPLLRAIALPQVPGWHVVPCAPRIAWEPCAHGADHRRLGRYADASGRVVDVYASKGEGRKVVDFGERAVAWPYLGPAIHGPDLAGAKADRVLAEGRVERPWYRMGDLTSGSNARLKLANMADRLLLRARPTTMLILSAEERPGTRAQSVVNAFLRAIGPRDQWMDHNAGVR